ncbi:hypothetical protein HPB51_022961 [Rhipicephalus microplus]|uniref:Chitin-binding type-2 domain-containing protein n=1 Tax=Rhipicephalus microplus TaxID=6941 RepID=A0A9J6DCH2_RHIMP|nr:hypothetical protein HPB51_022961 [Rhipicephalus microplus]
MITRDGVVEGSGNFEHPAAVTASIEKAVAAAGIRSHDLRTRRAAYELPDGVEFVVGGVQTTFQCERSGYFADVSNNCQLFHICNEIYKEDGSVELQQYSFFCGNQTVFNQLSLTCAHPEESVPCQNAPDFFYINDNIGRLDAPAHTEDDLQRAAPLVPGFQQQQSFAAASNRLETKVNPQK